MKKLQLNSNQKQNFAFIKMHLKLSYNILGEIVAILSRGGGWVEHDVYRGSKHI